MNKNKTDLISQKNKGFTLIEILTVVAIIGLLLSVVIVSIKSSKNKASDLQVKQTLSDIAVKVESLDIAPGVIDYTQAFNSIDVPAKISELATKTATNSSGYEYSVTASQYAVSFSLKNGKYWCVDNKTGQVRTKEVVGLFETTGSKDCDNATRIASGGGGGGGGGGSNTPPVLTLNGEQVVGGTVWAGYFIYKGASVYGVLPEYWPEPSYTATDAEDGNITANVVISFPDAAKSPFSLREKLIAFAENIFSVDLAFAQKGGGCLGETARHYSVTDSQGNTVHAYRTFTSVCS